MKARSPNESMIEMNELVLPNDTNLLGNLLGGTLLHWIDIAGAMAAQKHSNSVVATVCIDVWIFGNRCVGRLSPLKPGDLGWSYFHGGYCRVFAEDYLRSSRPQQLTLLMWRWLGFKPRKCRASSWRPMSREKGMLRPKSAVHRG